MSAVDHVIGTPSFIQVNVSGGEPSEIQDKIKVTPIWAFTTEGVAVVMNG